MTEQSRVIVANNVPVVLMDGEAQEDLQALINIWPDGTVTVALREREGHRWGPPVTGEEELRDGNRVVTGTEAHREALQCQAEEHPTAVQCAMCEAGVHAPMIDASGRCICCGVKVR